MAYRTADAVTGEFELSKPWTAYWAAFLRVTVGWWFFHAGVTKLIESGLSYGYAATYLRGMTGTALGPVPVWMGNELG